MLDNTLARDQLHPTFLRVDVSRGVIRLVDNLLSSNWGACIVLYICNGQRVENMWLLAGEHMYSVPIITRRC